MKLCVDLCSGLGGFSEAFVQNPEWSVIRVDIDKKFKPTIQADVCFLPLKEKLYPDVLLMSPPCERFSIACRSWPKIGIKKAMELIGACFEAIAYLKPKRWLLENPMGRLRWFLGKPPVTIRQCDYGALWLKKTDLWGNVPLPMLKKTKQPKLWVLKEGHYNAKKPKPTPSYFHYGTSGSGNGKAFRSKLPLGLSEAVLEAVS